MSKFPVGVYGASGYTGRLVCEYLREYKLPFVAGGRDKDRVASVMANNVPGITEIAHEARAVTHTVDGIAEAFDGCKVIINTVGPFGDLGHEVIQACAKIGAHYLDTTGEQFWMLDADKAVGEEFADKGLVLAPGIAQMYTLGEIAACYALEGPLYYDTLDILVLWKGAPTTASTETIFATLMADHLYLEDNEYVEWPAGWGGEVPVPGQHETAIVAAWGGTAHPVWFKNHAEVANVKAIGGVFNKTVMGQVGQINQVIEEQVKPLPTKEEQDAAIAEIKKSVAAPMPPRENQLYNRSLESVYASGPAGVRHVALYGSQNYKQTGLLNAYGAHQLIHGRAPKQVGLASGCQLWGHRELHKMLKMFGLVGDPVITD